MKQKLINWMFILKIFFTICIECFKFILFFGNYEFIDNLLKKLVNCNLLFVKIYQSISTNSLVLNEKYINILRKYTDNVPYETKNRDIKIIKNAGFDINETKLINSGTIAAVYKSTYKNVPVVIKIKKDNIFLKEEIKKMEFICYLLSYIPFFNCLNINKIILTNKDIILNQLDFNKEIQNAITMKKIHSRINYVKIPYVYEEFTKKNNDLIVMEYLNGKTIYDIDKNDKEKYSELFAQFGIKSLLYDGIYHADMHPGNIIFMKQNENLILGVIDFGIINHLSKNEQNEFFNFFRFINNKFNLASHIFEKLSYCTIKNKEIIESDKEKLLYQLQEIVDVFKNKMTIHEIYNISKLLKNYHYKLQDYFYKLLLGLISSESTINYLTNDKNNLVLLNKTFEKMLGNIKIE